MAATRARGRERGDASGARARRDDGDDAVALVFSQTNNVSRRFVGIVDDDAMGSVD